MANPTTFQVRPVQRTAYTGAHFRRNNLTYLVQFTNDMNGDRKYAYPSGAYVPTVPGIVDYGSETYDYQYSEITFEQVNTKAQEDVYKGRIYLEPSGFWYYVICEVNFYDGIEIEWDGNPFSLMIPGYAPINFGNDFDEWGGVGPEPTDYNKGFLGIIVEEGKLQVKQKPREVTYSSYDEGTKENYIYNGE
tara:strand:- start:4759 stop:5331 length:573 start_codon:yes stop_codon:yes gene_type:complete